MDEQNREPLAPETAPQSAPAPSEPQPEYVTVVSVRFRDGGKEYDFDPGTLKLAMGDTVIVDTARGSEFGTCAAPNHRVPASGIVTPLRKVIRRTSERDLKRRAENAELEKEAFDVCQKRIEEMKLDMQLVSAECLFDGSKLIFCFTAEERVDFRELVRILASTFHMRIELRQIGVRDKARMIGGFGICGRPFCCREFLSDFAPVSIKMAKTQNLSLNPTKISGTCGRLLCCLKYEQEAYEDLIHTAPKPESLVDTPSGRGTIADLNLLRQTVRVRLENAPDTIVTCKLSEIFVLRNGKARKTDPAIPEDYAPISGAQKRPAAEPREELPEVRFRAKPARADAPKPETKKTEAKKPDTRSAEASPAAEGGRRHRRFRRRSPSSNHPKEGNV